MPYGNLHRPDRLFLPQQALLRFAAGVPTPFFLYDEDGIRKSACTIIGSFCWNRGHRPWFPLMANASPSILKLLREEGFGVLVQSEPELLHACRCGFSGEGILLHTPAMTERLAALAKELGCAVIFDDPCQIDKMANQLPNRCLLRFRPERFRCGPGITADGEKSKSGMDHAQLLQAAERLSCLGVKEIGLHCQITSDARNEAYYPAVAEVLFALAAELRNRLEIEVCCFDLGGGISPLQNLPHIGAVIRERFQSAFSEDSAPAIYTELGRYVLGRHGLLVSRVVEVREHTRRHLILDASAAALQGLAERRIGPHISVVGDCSRRDRMLYCVHGCTPELHDRFHDRAVLPKVQPGAVVAIHEMGAYGASLQSRICMLPQWDGYLYTPQGEFLPADRITASEGRL